MAGAKQDFQKFLDTVQAEALIEDHADWAAYSVKGNEQQLIRIFKPSTYSKPKESSPSITEFLLCKRNFLAYLAVAGLSVATPEIFEIKMHKSTVYTKESRISGVTMAHMLQGKTSELQIAMCFNSLFAVIDALHNIDLRKVFKITRLEAGNVLMADNFPPFKSCATWAEYLACYVQSMQKREILGDAVNKLLLEKIAELCGDIAKISLLHGAWSFYNCLVDDHNRNAVIGVVGFEDQMLFGDPNYDLVGAFVFAQILGDRKRTAVRLVLDTIKERNINPQLINLYQVLYALRLVNDKRYSAWAKIVLFKATNVISDTNIWGRLQKDRKNGIMPGYTPLLKQAKTNQTTLASIAEGEGEDEDKDDDDLAGNNEDQGMSDKPIIAQLKLT